MCAYYIGFGLRRISALHRAHDEDRKATHATRVSSDAVSQCRAMAQLQRTGRVPTAGTRVGVRAVHDTSTFDEH